MGYYVLKDGKSWRLVHAVGKKNKPRSINKHSPEALEKGFSPAMTLEQAKERAKQIQSEDWVKRDAESEASRWRIQAKLKRAGIIRSAFLKEEDAIEFEKNWLPVHRIQRAHWNTMQKIIVAVEIHPEDWLEQKNKLYEQFVRFHCSPNYAKKLLQYLNLWGYFLCKKQKRAWMKVPGLTGVWKNRLEAARKKTSARPSLPLSPQMLEDKRNSLDPAHYRWLFVSVWFGLRPREIDNFSVNNPELWHIQEDQTHGYVLAVFQEKLFERGVAKEDCWKFIPTVFPEQRIAIQFILEGGMRRPCGAQDTLMRKVFGQGYSTYAGRNNFSGLLRGAGFDKEARQHWMGHLSSVQTDAYDRKTLKGRVFYREPQGTVRAPLAKLVHLHKK